MSDSPLTPHLATPAELKERLELERAGEPFLVCRDADGKQRLAPLPDREVTIGRDPGSDVCLGWDERVSGLHAELRRMGSQWLVVDDGLSRNGTFVNEERVVGRKRLRDRDQLRVGATTLEFRNPFTAAPKSTAVASERVDRPELSPAQRRVLVALCRPFREEDPYARPPTNQQLAEELFLSVPAVKTHLRLLFQRFGVENLPHNEKRARLVRLALESGAVTFADLRDS